MERPGQPKKFEDEDLVTLLDEDPCQTLRELSISLGVDFSTVGKRLKAIGMVQKQGTWVPHELKPRDVERRLVTCEILHDNARPHVAKVVKTYLNTLKWEVLPHPPYSPDIAPSDYHLFRSMAHGLSEQHFDNYEMTKNWIDSFIESKEEEFFRRGIRALPERWQKVVDNEGQYFE